MRIRRLLAVFSLIVLLLPAVVVGTAAALEGHDPFCSACHTEPETEYVLRSLSDPIDLASAHTPAEVRCVDCHSGEGLLGRSVSLKQGASDLAAYISNSYAQPAVTTNPVGEVGCTKCHEAPSSVGVYARTEGDVTSSHYHFREYTAEWLSQELDARGSCGICHKSHTLNTLANQGFVINSELNAACEACHAALSGWIPPAR
ncbi:MAG: hypothetical protein ACE5JF_05105 [Anaerolineales bacterium]